MKKLTLIILTFLIYKSANAQDLLKPDSSRYLNLRYIEFYRQNHPLSYIAPLGELGSKNKYIFTSRLTTSFMVFGSKSSRLAIALIPDFTIRMLDLHSKPVYTPDFRIGGALYYRLNDDEKKYKYATLGFMHHSNGQDTTHRPVVGTLNYKDWDFSTNYIYGKYNWGKVRSNGNILRSSLNQQLEFKSNGLFDYDNVIKGDYGFTRIGYSLSYRTYTYFYDLLTSGDYKEDNNRSPDRNDDQAGWLNKERFRWNLEASYAINKYDNYNFFAVKRRLNIEATAYYSPFWMRQTSLMLGAGYYGEDPYNIYFKDKYAWIRFGIAVGFLKYTAKAKGKNHESQGLN
ncbi:hypothetical protein [Pedobacter miscanthi]|uniref:DUF4421 domain-containing protein n=1 Tax=Pedobacter miscanthi TaxID=2259170 RepID=A0A366KTL2_9SPHI|nr:hypothetical protein [Pedobacter miscanthi]RBQ04956.1 hypothetical protein DRW42_17735 [Pedobacter miscanthi]